MSGGHPRRSMNRCRRALINGLPVLVLLAAVTSSCGDEAGRDDAVNVVSGAELYFFESTTDLVTFADYAVFATVADETIGPTPSDADEGLVRRDATINVERVLWTYDSKLIPPESFRLQLDGFTYTRGESLVPYRFEGAPRLEVGDEFIGVFNVGSEGPLLLTQSSALLVQDGRVALTDEQAARAPDDLVGGMARADLDDKSVDEVGEILHSTRPQPASEKYSAIPPRGSSVGE